VFADWLSRMYNSGDVVSDESHQVLQAVDAGADSLSSRDPVDSLIDSVHNERMGHHGALRTYALLNQYHSGHGLSMATVKDFVRECVYCQKVR